MTSPLIDVNGQPLTIRRGTTPTHVFNIVEQGTTNPKNLVAASEVTFAIAARRKANTRILELTLGNGVSHNGEGGVVSVTFSSAQTESLPAGTLWAELWITDSQDRRDIVAEGDCIAHDSLVFVP